MDHYTGKLKISDYRAKTHKITAPNESGAARLKYRHGDTMVKRRCKYRDFPEFPGNPYLLFVFSL